MMQVGLVRDLCPNPKVNMQRVGEALASASTRFCCMCAPLCTLPYVATVFLAKVVMMFRCHCVLHCVLRTMTRKEAFDVSSYFWRTQASTRAIPDVLFLSLSPSVRRCSWPRLVEKGDAVPYSVCKSPGIRFSIQARVMYRIRVRGISSSR